MRGVNWVYTTKSFDDLAGQSDVGIFVDFPKFCQTDPGSAHNNPRAGAPGVVSARSAQLVSAGGLLISTRRYWKDEAEFEGIVDFMGLGEVGSAYRALAREPAETRARLADERLARFRTRFSAGSVFEKAGIYRDLSDV